ncbi:SET domain containing protein [Novymonas esmeraldas]|uniref:SET domain containing protein n=1 Tax=Novymonas esmeraldas TaxID=1808958 RepID=A0AAW0F517_9TRYP
MSLMHRLHGARWCPLRQRHRRSDGVRGIFAAAPLDRGALILSVPLRYCHVVELAPRGVAGRSPAPLFESAEGAQQLRRCNRGVALLPETSAWLARFSPDAAQDRVSLRSTVSRAATSPAVVSVALSPVEAAVATAVALRYFYAHALQLPVTARVTHSLGPPPHDLSDRFVASLPFDVYLQSGLESLHGDSSAAESHLCLEQLSSNLRDAILTHANGAEYRLLDEAPSLLETVLLTSLYLVRARVLEVPLLSAVPGKPDGSCSVLAPAVDGLNHASASPSAAVVVSEAHRAVVVRAIRRVACGEEITLDYRHARGGRAGAATRPRSRSSAGGGGEEPLYAEEEEEEEEANWASRYLMAGGA